MNLGVWGCIWIMSKNFVQNVLGNIKEVLGPAAEDFLLRRVFVHCGFKDLLNRPFAPNPSLAKLAAGQLPSFKEVETPTQRQPGEFGIGADPME